MKTSTNASRTYYIQHQQIISPVEGFVNTDYINNNINNNNNTSRDVAIHKSGSSVSSLSSASTSTDSSTKLPNYHLTPLIYSSKSKSLSKLLEEDLSLIDSDHINPDLPTNEIVDVSNKRFLVQNHFRIANRDLYETKALTSDDSSDSECQMAIQAESICFSTNLPHCHNSSSYANPNRSASYSISSLETGNTNIHNNNNNNNDDGNNSHFNPTTINSTEYGNTNRGIVYYHGRV